MPTTHFPLTLQFRGRHGQRVFADAAELNSWLTIEADAYKGLASTKLSRSDDPLAGLLKPLRGLEAARVNSEKLMGLPQDDKHQEFASTIASTKQQLNAAYQSRGFPPSTSMEFQALLPVVQDDPHAALAALFALSEPTDHYTLNAMEPAIARGVGLAAALRYGLAGERASSAMNHAFDETLAAINRRADETSLRAREQIRLTEEAQTKANKAWDTHNEDYAKLTTSLEQKVGEAIDVAAKGVADFKAAYQSEIALKEPVKFWEDKGTSHKKRANQFALAAGAVALSVGVGAYLLLPRLLAPSADTARAAVAAASSAASAAPSVAPAVLLNNGSPSYYGIALAVLLSTLALWLLRILVRGYLSETHLATDAKERVAMVKTYLALMESGKAPTDTLNPVLVALFRPASDGLVRDDSMPLGVAELLTKTRGDGR